MRWIIIAMLLTFAPAISGDVAIQTNTLTYGDIVTGEITDDVFSVDYTFDGIMGDVIVVEMMRPDYQSDMDEPAVRVIGPDGTLLAENDGITNATVGVVLPEDGKYTVVATRADGAEGDATGEYRLRLLEPQRLVNGDKLEATIVVEEQAFYTIDTSQSYLLSYFKESGNYYPEIAINRISDDPDSAFGLGSLRAIATLNGSAIQAGQLSVEPVEDVYIVSLTRSIFSFASSGAESTITLTLEIFE